MDNFSERERLWIGVMNGLAPLPVQVGVLRQTRGWVRWAYLAAVLAETARTCHKAGRLVAYELARKDEEADAAARAAMERAHKERQAAKWAEEAETLRQTARMSWSNSSRYPGPV